MRGLSERNGGRAHRGRNVGDAPAVHPCGPRRARTRVIKWVFTGLALSAAVVLAASSALGHASDDSFLVHATQALNERPCDVGIRLARARRAIDAGEDAAARADLLAVQRCDPHAHAPAAAERARLAQQAGDLPYSIENASRARQLEPENASYAYLLAELQAQAGQHQLAARTAHGAFRLAPTPDVALLRIRIADAAGDRGAAFDLSTDAWTRFGPVPALVHAAVRLARATGRYDVVRARLAACGHPPWPPRTLLNAAELALRAGDRLDARGWLQQWSARAQRVPSAQRADAAEWARALGPDAPRRALPPPPSIPMRAPRVAPTPASDCP